MIFNPAVVQNEGSVKFSFAPSNGVDSLNEGSVKFSFAPSNGVDSLIVPVNLNGKNFFIFPVFSHECDIGNRVFITSLWSIGDSSLVSVCECFGYSAISQEISDIVDVAYDTSSTMFSVKPENQGLGLFFDTIDYLYCYW